VVVSAYFDESEREDAGQPICVGGFMFKPSGYKAFRRYWCSNVLRFRGRRTEPFHMTDLCAGHGVYEGLTIPERISILNHAVEAVKKHSIAAHGVCFDQKEFIAKAPPNWPQVFGSIYAVACQLCLQVTSYWLGQQGVTMPVLYVFERGHKFEDEADRFLKAIARNNEHTKRFRYRNHIFEPKSEVGLQAADLYAWTITKAKAASGVVPKGTKPFVQPLLKMVDGSNGRYRCGMFHGAMLDRFLEEARTNPVMVQLDRGPRKSAFR
jgi:hypothetical protein